MLSLFPGFELEVRQYHFVEGKEREKNARKGETRWDLDAEKFSMGHVEQVWVYETDQLAKEQDSKNVTLSELRARYKPERPLPAGKKPRVVEIKTVIKDKEQPAYILKCRSGGMFSPGSGQQKLARTLSKTKTLTIIVDLNANKTSAAHLARWKDVCLDARHTSIYATPRDDWWSARLSMYRPALQQKFSQAVEEKSSKFELPSWLLGLNDKGEEVYGLIYPNEQEVAVKTHFATMSCCCAEDRCA